MPEVQLIRPPLEDWYTVSQFQELISVPAGLCLLASSLKGKAKVQVLDGMYSPLERILERVDGNVVGVTDIYSTHRNALAILKKAKEEGATTIIGGPNINYLSERVLANNDFVDYAVVGDGEEALSMLVTGVDLEKIPNLVYRKDDKIVKNPRRNASLTALFDLEDLADWHNFNPSGTFPISSIRGCIKAERSNRCSFCSIDHKLKVMEPRLVWKQIGLLYGMYGADYFWDAGDTFVVGNYPQRLLEVRPKHLSRISLKTYTRPDDITPEIVRILRGLNAKEIFLGVESFNDKLLEKAGKNYTTKDILRALEVLDQGGFFLEGKLHIPFLFGLPGETIESAERTFRFAENLFRKYPLAKVVASMPVPFPGTMLFEDLRNLPEAREEYPGDLDKDDIFDYRALVRLQCEYFTSVAFEDMIEKVERTRSLVPEGSRTSFDINK